ncbi:MAG: alpha/beta fold hydrolase [Gemmobacter sp.]
MSAAAPRAVLAVHAALASAGAWAGLARELGPDATLRAFDLPGHGRNGDAAPEGHAMRAIDLCRAELAAMAGPCDLVGHSFGALVALWLALERPHAIRTLCLIEPVLFAAARGTPEHADHLRAHAPFASALAEGRREDAARDFLAVWGSGAPWEGLAPAQRAGLARRIDLIPAGALLTEDRTGTLLRPGGLESLDLPVLLVDGAASPPVIGAILRALGARLPDARRATIPGAGHMLPLSHPGDLAGVLRAFWS